MGKRDKLIQKILEGKIIKTSEAINLLDWLGYDTKQKGSHRSFRKADRKLITIVTTFIETPHYTIEDLQEALALDGYTL